MRHTNEHHKKPKKITAKPAAAKHASQKIIKEKKPTSGQLMIQKVTGIATVKISADKVLSITRGRS